MTLREALYDPLVQDAVAELTLEHAFPALERERHPEYDRLVSNRRVYRAATPADYVAAIRAVHGEESDEAEIAALLDEHHDPDIPRDFLIAPTRS